MRLLALAVAGLLLAAPLAARLPGPMWLRLPLAVTVADPSGSLGSSLVEPSSEATRGGWDLPMATDSGTT